MSVMSPKSRDLLKAARAARPTSRSRTRMSAALAARVGPIAAVVAAESAAAATTATTSAVALAPVAGAAVTAPIPAAPVLVSSGGVLTTAKVWVLGAVITAASAGVYATVARDDANELARPTAVVAAPPPESIDGARSTAIVEQRNEPPAESPSPELARTAAAAVSVAGERPFASSAPPRGERTKDGSLGRETALMEEALRSINDGDSTGALKTLDKLQSSNPDGLLAEEGLAARVFALCAAGRPGEARNAAERFLSEWPRSVQADRVRASCAFGNGVVSTTPKGP